MPELGEQDRCPHCGVVADSEPTRGLRYRCRVCGAPRVPLDRPGVERSGKELAPLKQAQRLRLRRGAWQVAGVALGSLGLLSFLITIGILMLVTPGLLASAAAAAAAATPLLLAAVALLKSRRVGREINAALDAAWRSVAADLVRHEADEMDAQQLGRAMRLEDHEAELLLSALSAQDVVRTRITDAGDVVYRASEPAQRLRVEAARTVVDLDDETPPSAARQGSTSAD